MSSGLIGLFGGTFDPAHSGHFAVAEAALKTYDFCRLVFIPAGDPYLKSDIADSVISSSEHRVEMVRLALEHHGNPRFELSETETRREGPSYTLDTARLFAVENPQSEILSYLEWTLFCRCPVGRIRIPCFQSLGSRPSLDLGLTNPNCRLFLLKEWLV